MTDISTIPSITRLPASTAAAPTDPGGTMPRPEKGKDVTSGELVIITDQVATALRSNGKANEKLDLSVRRLLAQLAKMDPADLTVDTLKAMATSVGLAVDLAKSDLSGANPKFKVIEKFANAAFQKTFREDSPNNFGAEVARLATGQPPEVATVALRPIETGPRTSDRNIKSQKYGTKKEGMPDGFVVMDESVRGDTRVDPQTSTGSTDERSLEERYPGGVVQLGQGFQNIVGEEVGFTQVGIVSTRNLTPDEIDDTINAAMLAQEYHNLYSDNPVDGVDVDRLRTALETSLVRDIDFLDEDGNVVDPRNGSFVRGREPQSIYLASRLVEASVLSEQNVLVHEAVHVGQFSGAIRTNEYSGSSQLFDDNYSSGEERELGLSFAELGAEDQAEAITFAFAFPAFLQREIDDFRNDPDVRSRALETVRNGRRRLAEEARTATSNSLEDVRNTESIENEAGRDRERADTEAG